MAGLLYLPRLFVYHCEEKNNSETYKKFLVMERRLLKFIMMPAMIATWIFGISLYLINIENIAFSFWFSIKFFLVIATIGISRIIFPVCRKKFMTNSNKNSPRFYRIINEVPTIILILIVFLVTFKPSL